jgi:hypothetical protein
VTVGVAKSLNCTDPWPTWHPLAAELELGVPVDSDRKPRAHLQLRDGELSAEHTVESMAVRRPRSDGRAVMDSLLGPAGYFEIAATHRRGLFQHLDGKRLTAAEICEALELKPRPVNALLAVAASIGLLELSDERYSLTEQAETTCFPPARRTWAPSIS